jgi:uncharacterized membrane protein YesL
MVHIVWVVRISHNHVVPIPHRMLAQAQQLHVVALVVIMAPLVVLIIVVCVHHQPIVPVVKFTFNVVLEHHLSMEVVLLIRVTVCLVIMVSMVAIHVLCAPSTISVWMAQRTKHVVKVAIHP